MSTIAERLEQFNRLLDGKATIERYATREEWLKARAPIVGASDLPILLGLASRSTLELWAEKVGKLSDEDQEQSEAAEFGLALEPIVKRKYRERTHRRLLDLPSWTMIRSVQYPWMGASLDDVVLPVNGTAERGPAPFEAKTTAAWNLKEWDEEPPLAYQAQVSWQLAVTGWLWGSIGVVIGGQKFRHVDLERNDKFIEEAQAVALKFHEHVMAGTEPAAGPEDQKILGLLYARPTGGTVVDLPPAALDWDNVIRDGERRIKAIQKDVDHAKNLIRQAIGESEAGVLPLGGGIWTNKLVAETEIAYTRKAYRQLRRKDAKGEGD